MIIIFLQILTSTEAPEEIKKHKIKNLSENVPLESELNHQNEGRSITREGIEVFSSKNRPIENKKFILFKKFVQKEYQFQPRPWSFFLIF